LPRNGLASQLSLLSSETPTASESSQSDGPESPSSPTFAMWGTPNSHPRTFTPRQQTRPRDEAYQLANQVAVASSLSPVGSLANLIPLQESVRRLLTIVTSGPRLPVCFARFDRDGSSGRMFAVSSTPSLDGSLVEYSGTWPTWGIALDGACGELPTLERCTSGSESSSWPTPHGMCSPNPRRAGPSGNELGRAVNQAMWPTPAARGWRSESCSPVYQAEREGQTRGKTLPWAVKTWATPHANCSTGAGSGPQKQGGENLQTQVGGSLNPTWVEWLMGFPLGWTALEPSEMPSSRSKRSRSSLKSQGSSE
jgi:hypothetical protein